MAADVHILNLEDTESECDQEKAAACLFPRHCEEDSWKHWYLLADDVAFLDRWLGELVP